MYHGWYKGKREFGSAVVPWEFCLAEWDAQFYGAAAYQIGEHGKGEPALGGREVPQGRLWQRWDYPFSLNYTLPEREGSTRCTSPTTGGRSAPGGCR